MTNSHAVNGIYGTKTFDNLKSAFENESYNHTRALIYADIAKNEGDYDASSRLQKGADNDKRLAELWLSYIDELGDTAQNLDYLASHKNSLKSDIYPAMALDAEDDGFFELAEKMRLAAMTKDSQSKELSSKTDEHNQIMTPEEPVITKWKCGTCGYTVTGEMPDRCPLCAYPWES